MFRFFIFLFPLIVLAFVGHEGLSGSFLAVLFLSSPDWSEKVSGNFATIGPKSTSDGALGFEARALSFRGKHIRLASLPQSKLGVENRQLGSAR
jgi:hypothetical protein